MTQHRAADREHEGAQYGSGRGLLGVRQRLARILAAVHASVEELQTELAPGVC
jgi:hypothetical protein